MRIYGDISGIYESIRGYIGIYGGKSGFWGSRWYQSAGNGPSYPKK